MNENKENHPNWMSGDLCEEERDNDGKVFGTLNCL
jgi:hypothetical protein